MSDSDDPETAAMAAAMGFSSFGPAKKKRKYNTSADAFVEGQGEGGVHGGGENGRGNRDKGGKKGQGSGGNTVRIPEGRMRVFGTGGDKKREVKGGDEEEIVLDLEDEDGDEEGGVGLGIGLGTGIGMGIGIGGNRGVSGISTGVDGGDEEDGPQYIDTSLPAPLDLLTQPQNQDETEEEEQPQYMDTSLPPPISTNAFPLPLQSKSSPVAPKLSKGEEDKLQAKIDEILNTTQAPPGVGIAKGGLGIELGFGLPERPPPVVGIEGPPGYTNSSVLNLRQVPPPAQAQAQGQGYGRGGGGRGRERNENWHIGYYDPSFNENPWEQLEKEKGLESLGKWLERGHWDRGKGEVVRPNKSG